MTVRYVEERFCNLLKREFEKFLINISNLIERNLKMQNLNREVIVSTKVDKNVADELKRIAKQKDLRFSGYVKKVLTTQIEREKQMKEKQK